MQSIEILYKLQRIALGNETDLSLPDSIATIGQNAFDGCSSLTSVNIPNGITALGEGLAVSHTAEHALKIQQFYSWAFVHKLKKETFIRRFIAALL